MEEVILSKVFDTLKKINETVEKIYDEIRDVAHDEKTMSYALTKLDDIDVFPNKKILSRDISFGTYCLLRVMVAFDKNTQFGIVLNGKTAWLNEKVSLQENCIYVFDIPVKPGDMINFIANFDAALKSIKCLFIRLFEIRR